VEALALISAPGISTYIGPLLGYICPSASDVSRLIYIDRIIKSYKRSFGRLQSLANYAPLQLRALRISEDGTARCQSVMARCIDIESNTIESNLIFGHIVHLYRGVGGSGSVVDRVTSDTSQQDVLGRVSTANVSCGAYINFTDHSLGGTGRHSAWRMTGQRH